jgi:hypothetical protein
MADSRVLPTWAPRVTQREIRQLYETDARGIYDEDLINEVGYGLLARCESFITAVEAFWGRVRCPRCGAVVIHHQDKTELLHCDCGWELTWGEYFVTIQHKQLSGAEPVLEQFRAFVEGFPKARTPQARMILIDQLIHGFHFYLEHNTVTRPVAVNLIEGRLSEVVAFLDSLSRGESSTPGVAEHYAEWDRNLGTHPDWYKSRRKSGG